jgi:hypothetical protein
LRRLITRIKPATVALARSRRLISATAPGFHLTSRLIDGTYPDCETVAPKPSLNAATCNRVELIAALARLRAIALADPPPEAALAWTSGGPLGVWLARAPDEATDEIGASATGAARIAVPLGQLAGMLDNFGCERLRLEADAAGPLVLRDGAGKLALISRSAWKFLELESVPGAVAQNATDVRQRPTEARAVERRADLGRR